MGLWGWASKTLMVFQIQLNQMDPPDEASRLLRDAALKAQQIVMSYSRKAEEVKQTDYWNSGESICKLEVVVMIQFVFYFIICLLWMSSPGYRY